MSTALAPIEATPGIPDDVADPITPPGALPPPVTLDDLMGGLRALARSLDAALATLPSTLERQGQALGDEMHAMLRQLPPEGAAALEHLCEALDALRTTGLPGAAYAATVSARTPSGFALSLAIQRSEPAAFFDALTKLDAWLLASAYTPIA